MTDQEKAFQQLIDSMDPTPLEGMVVPLRDFFDLGWQAGQALWNSSNFDQWWNRDVVPNQPSDLPDWFIELMELAARTGWVNSFRAALQQGGV